VAAFSGLRGHPRFEVLVTALSLALIVAVTVVGVVCHLRRAATGSALQRRVFVTAWVGQALSAAVFWAIVRLATPSGDPELMLLIAPLWLHATACSFFTFAPEFGRLYLSAAAFFALSVAAVLVLPWAPDLRRDPGGEPGLARRARPLVGRLGPPSSGAGAERPLLDGPTLSR
jgi:hypothetical protein